MTPLECECGRLVSHSEVFFQEYYIRRSGPSFVYIKFRCRACNRLCERFVRQEEWWRQVCKSGKERVRDERERFSSLGPITEAEHRSARRQLRYTNPLSMLARWLPRTDE